MRSLILLCAVLLSARAQAVLTLEMHGYNETCSNANGIVIATVYGGVPPYTYAWSTGGTDYQITGLTAGTYSVTVTDANSDQLTDQVTLIDVPNLEAIPESYQFGEVVVSNAGQHACPGVCNGGFSWTEQFTPNAVPPFTYDPLPWDETPGMGAYFNGYCGGAHPTLTVTDASGCTGTFNISAVPEAIMEPVIVTNIDPSCGNTGTITVDVGSNCWCDVQLMDENFAPIGNLVSLWSGPLTFSNLAPGDYHVSRSNMIATGGCPEIFDMTVPDLGPDCGVVSGSVFLDHDQDCVRDGNDEGLPFRVLTISPGPEFAITDGSGNYARGLLYGSFTIAQPTGQIQQLCPVSDPVPFDLQVGLPTATVNFADSSLVPLDVAAGMSSTPARPGFTLTYYMAASSNSGQISGALDATFTFDPALTFISAYPSPTSTTAGSVSWSGLANLGAFGSRSFSVQLMVPVGTPLGTLLNAGFSVSQPLTETTLANNSVTISTTVTGSFDPNDKTARTSSGTSTTEYVIGTDNSIDYTIRFQNTGTDTAFTVVVRDTLPEELDMGSFEQGLASHPFTVAFRSGRVVEWTFADILLPDSGTNEAASHGLLSFRIHPALPLLPGTVISNTADIYFDFNEPVITEPSVLTAVMSTAIMTTEANAGLFLFPQPASDRIHVRVNGAMPTTMYRLLQADGRLIRSGRLGADGVDLSTLTSGSYVLAVQTTSGWAHARVIKDR